MLIAETPPAHMPTAAEGSVYRQAGGPCALTGKETVPLCSHCVPATLFLKEVKLPEGGSHKVPLDLYVLGETHCTRWIVEGIVVTTKADSGMMVVGKFYW